MRILLRQMIYGQIFNQILYFPSEKMFLKRIMFWQHFWNNIISVKLQRQIWRFVVVWWNFAQKNLAGSELFLILFCGGSFWCSISGDPKKDLSLIDYKFLENCEYCKTKLTNQKSIGWKNFSWDFFIIWSLCPHL